MSIISRNLLTVAFVVVAYTLSYMLNDWLFKQIEFTQGVAWVYLPAGLRLICTLLFAEAGVLGILFGSLLTSSMYALFPGDPITTIGYSLISALAPYFAYRYTLQEMRLERSLSNLTTTNLLICILLYGLCNPLLQLAWFIMRGVSSHYLPSLIVMSIGDLTGSLIVVYAFKTLLSFVPLPHR
ncbi:hypothetical protein [Solimicrobium silvestre]|uniref:MASE1 domain-containing protein n=1 Tax=Solimicrobium silvestre TaxID=2099400 RepID=A0A2S9H3Z0_9BURK|nr:hypothetical protein [Solimicrobium silvestre]PRC94687.1 hypothetical protein S2091_0690 [Solimicrobium silvestre]